jgi:hypothetical protein
MKGACERMKSIFGRTAAVVAALFVCTAPAALFSQAASTVTQGFSVDNLAFELMIFMPPDQAGIARAGAPPAGAQSPQGGAQTGTQRQAGQGGFFTVQRDPKLYFTATQIDSLIPLLQDLRKNPFPTPSGAKKLEAGIDGILTAAQKAERGKLIAEREKAAAQAAQGEGGGTGANGAGNSGGPFGQFQNFQNMTPDQRQAYLNSLPADQRARAQQRMQQQASQPELTPTEQRQRTIDRLIEQLQAMKQSPGK